ncbi:TKL protein kinase, partial [Salpingoeca rosetta]
MALPSSILSLSPKKTRAARAAVACAWLHLLLLALVPVLTCGVRAQGSVTPKVDTAIPTPPRHPFAETNVLCLPESLNPDSIASSAASILHVGCSAHSTLCREAKAELRQLLQLVHGAPHVHNTTDVDDKSDNRTGDGASDPPQPQATATALQRALTFFCDSGSGGVDSDELHPVKEQQAHQATPLAADVPTPRTPSNGDFFGESAADPPLSRPPPGVQKHQRSAAPRGQSRSRTRRNEINFDAAHAVCTLSSLLFLNCTSPPTAVPTSTLEVIVDADEELGALTTQPDPDFNTTIAAEYVRQQTAAWEPQRLFVSGAVYLEDLVWLLNSGTWDIMANLRLTGLHRPTLCLNIFNPLARVRDIRISDGHVIRLAQRCSDDEPTFQPLLKQLRVHRMGIREIEDGTFRDLGALNTVDLQGNQLTTLTASTLLGLRHVDTLTLRDNHIGVIEDGAFAGMTQLRILNLIENDLTKLAEQTFSPLSTLHSLHLGSNPIDTLPPRVFSSQTRLKILAMNNCNLQRLPPALFQNTTVLREVRFDNNQLSQVPNSLFHPLRQLARLELNHNRLARVDALWAGTLETLLRLQLDSNALTVIDPSLVPSAPRLTILSLHHNALDSSVLLSLRDHAQLTSVVVSFNRITTIPAGALRNMTRLVHLSLTDNFLTAFPPRELPSLLSLHLRNNPLTAQPDVSGYPQLDEVALTNHRIPHLDVTPLLRLTLLHRLEIAAASDVPFASVALSDLGSLPGLKQLVAVDMRNMDVTPLLGLVQTATAGTLAFRELSLGWSGMDEVSFPLEDICALLHDNVIRFELSNTAFTHVRLCDGVAYDAVFLQDNLQLQSVSSVGGVQQLNVSGCPHLQQLQVPSAEVLDISGTRVPLFRGLCTSLGTRTVVARNWQTGDLTNTARLRQLLSQCLAFGGVDVLDLSDNAQLNRPSVVNSVLSEVVVLGAEGLHLTHDFAFVPGRPSIGLLQLADNPITCQLQFVNVQTRIALQIRHFRSQELGYFYTCQCAQGYEHRGGHCRVIERDNTAAVLGTLAGLLAFQGILFAAYRTYTRQRRLQADNALKEQLLVERDAEVMALKKVWEIEYDELRMIKRVAAGAFGVVFKAQWDTVTVAVKVLQQGVMMFDESTVVEFEKEVEFLQRTRHPHVVRFFGAGTDPNGSPFLVLEFVAMGSLKDLLGKDMARVLQEVAERNNDDDAEGEEREEKAEGMAGVWELKLRLLRDVASGMAFIHSLDQVHRDLKSGNVLVSSRLRAKITDFGSIRQCLA